MSLRSPRPGGSGRQGGGMAKVAIVGWSDGLRLAALMVDAGHDVHAVTLWAGQPRRSARRDSAARVRAANGRYQIQASTTTDGIGICDLVIIATEAFDMKRRHARGAVAGTSRLQTIQDGLGSPEIAPRSSGRSTSPSASSAGSVRRCADRATPSQGMEMIRFGPYAALPAGPSARRRGDLEVGRLQGRALRRTSSGWLGEADHERRLLRILVCDRA